MKAISTRIPDELNKQLNLLAKETERGKGYLVRRALENYLEDEADILIALSRIERGEATISLDDIEKKYGLED